MSRDVATLQIQLEHALDQVQSLHDLVGAMLAQAGGTIELQPCDVHKARDGRLQIFTDNGTKVVVLHMVPRG